MTLEIAKGQALQEMSCFILLATDFNHKIFYMLDIAMVR